MKQLKRYDEQVKQEIAVRDSNKTHSRIKVILSSTGPANMLNKNQRLPLVPK